MANFRTRPSAPNASSRTNTLLNLRYPFREADVRNLPLGATVSISGTVFTGRDRLHRYLADGGAAPVDLHDCAIFHCGPIVVPDKARGGWKIVAAGPTTSSRENPYMPLIIEKHGVRVILGKGGMDPATQDACRKYGCVYIQVVGGAAAWLAKCVKKVGNVWFFDEFGATEAMWKLEVENLTGIVAIDAYGESIFSGVEQFSKGRLDALLGMPLELGIRSGDGKTTKYTGPAASAGMPPPLKIVFMGSADVSAMVLKALVKTPGFQVAGAITQPDRPAGRHRVLKPCIAKSQALELEVPVISPEKVNTPEVREQIAAWRPDVIIVVAYGQFLGAKILAMPPLGCLNIHLSLLPRHRGAAPIHRCIESGDTISGVTIMKMDHGMDSGDILMQEVEPIHADDTAGSLHGRLSDLGAKLIIECLPKWRAGLITPQQQRPEFVTFANKLRKEEAKVNWEETSAKISLRVRAFNPWPAAHVFFSFRRIETNLDGAEVLSEPETERLKILRAVEEEVPEGAERGEIGTVADISDEGPAIATSDGWVRLLEVQRSGGRPVSGADFLNGCPLRIGDRFDLPDPEKPAQK